MRLASRHFTAFHWHDIRATSDLDVNRSEGEFSFDPAQFAGFVAQLRPAGDSFRVFGSSPYMDMLVRFGTWTFPILDAMGKDLTNR